MRLLSRFLRILAEDSPPPPPAPVTTVDPDALLDLALVMRASFLPASDGGPCLDNADLIFAALFRVFPEEAGAEDNAGRAAQDKADGALADFLASLRRPEIARDHGASF